MSQYDYLIIGAGISSAVLVREQENIVFADRLGAYKHYDMDKAIAATFDLITKELEIHL